MDNEKGILGLLGPFLRNFILFLYALFALFPLLWMVILSFKPDEQMFTTTFIFSPTLENFQAVLGQEGFLELTLEQPGCKRPRCGAFTDRGSPRSLCVGKVSI